ncbi:hypothetical protein RFI_23906, partial [Reticulomyxa filosa]
MSFEPTSNEGEEEEEKVASPTTYANIQSLLHRSNLSETEKSAIMETFLQLQKKTVDKVVISTEENNSIQRLEEVMEQVKKKESEIKKLTEKITQGGDQCKRTVDKRMDQLIQMIQMKRRELMTSVDKIVAQQMHTIQTHVHSIKQLYAQLKL